jgi:hypothetical protein
MLSERRLASAGHEIGFGIAHGLAALGAIGFEGRFDSYRFNTTRDFDRQKWSDPPSYRKCQLCPLL